MTLALVAAHDATLPKPAPVPVPGGFGWPDGELPEGLTGEDVTRIFEAIAAGRVESTRKTYASAWRRFEGWCAKRTIAPLPATPATVCAYLAVRLRKPPFVEPTSPSRASCPARSRAPAPPSPTHTRDGHPNRSQTRRARPSGAASVAPSAPHHVANRVR